MKRKVLLIVAFLLFSGTMFAQDYYWSEFNYHQWSSYQTVYGKVYLDGELQNRGDVEVAAFVDDELRGRQFLIESWPDTSAGYYIWTLCYSDIAGEVFTYKAYDHASGILYDLCDTQFISTDTQGSFGSADEPVELRFTRTVQPTYGPEYPWVPSTAYASEGMLVTAQVKINGQLVDRDSYEVGAFCGDECRGTSGNEGLVDFTDDELGFFAFMNIMGNDGDIINFYLYDLESNSIFQGVCDTTIQLENGGELGIDIFGGDIFVLNFVALWTQQTSTFSQGWNWWSTYIEQDGINGLTMLEESLGANGHQIKSQTNFVTNYGVMWMGLLNGINNEETYMIDNTSDCQIEMTGALVSPADHPISISNGWNWIGYPCTSTMTVAEAFANYEPANGDYVKSQSDYAMYFSGIWIGQLQDIAPGTGLMYLSNNATPTTLVYPNGGRNTEATVSVPKTLHWTNDVHAYPDNMTLMAVVELDDVELTTDSYELSAFSANGECRGSAKLMYVEPLNRHVAFMTVSGKDVAELSFRLYDNETGKEYYEAKESLSFTSNAIVGDPSDLYVVHFRGMTGMDEFAGSVQVYPNPVNRGERFSVGMTDNDMKSVRVEIVNTLGMALETVCAPSEQTITAPKAAGVYTLRITVEGKGIVVRKLVVR